MTVYAGSLIVTETLLVPCNTSRFLLCQIHSYMGMAAFARLGITLAHAFPFTYRHVDTWLADLLAGFLSHLVLLILVTDVASCLNSGTIDIMDAGMELIGLVGMAGFAIFQCFQIFGHRK